MTSNAEFDNLTVRLGDDLHNAFSRLAERRNLLVRQLHSEAIERYMARRQGGEALPFVPSRSDAKQRTVWLAKGLRDAVEEAARHDRVSKTVIALTAFSAYLDEQGDEA